MASSTCGRSSPAKPAAAPASRAQPGGAAQRNVVGRLALTLSAGGSICVAVALITLVSPPIASGVLLIISWVLLPVAFILGISGAILPGRPKGSSVTALVISVTGGAASAYVTVTMLLAMGYNLLPR